MWIFESVNWFVAFLYMADKVGGLFNLFHCSSFYSMSSGDDGADLSEWMTNLPLEIKRKPITKIAIPGGQSVHWTTLFNYLFIE